MSDWKTAAYSSMGGAVATIGGGELFGAGPRF